MKYILLFLSLITTGLAYSQQTPVKIYATGAGNNSNTGDPLPTWAQKYNQNDFNLNLVGTASGTDTYSVTISAPSPGYYTGIAAPSSYVTGQRFLITFTNANTGASTLNINSIGAKSLVKQGGTALAASDIRAGQVLELYYDGTNLQIVGDGGSVAGAAAWSQITGTPTTVSGYGITDAVTLTGSQTLTNKTLTSPAITTPTGIVKGDVGLGNVDNTSDANKPVSTAQQSAIDAAKLRTQGFACSDLTTTITATIGATKGYMIFPTGFIITGVYASLLTGQTGGSLFTVDIKESGTSILSTYITIDNNETSSTTAATAAVVSDTSIAAGVPVTAEVRQVGTGSPVGLIVYIKGY